jgi:hypothetical protein
MIGSRKMLCVAVAVAAVLAVLQPPARGAPTLDLTTVGASGWVNGAYFEQIDYGSSGTGVIDPFVRLGTNNPVERGYNTDGTVEFNTKDDPHTHSLALSSIPLVYIDDTLYREFMLDVGEPGNTAASYLSLDTIEIYLADEPDLTGYPSLGTKVYDLQSSGDAWVLLRDLNSGNGQADAFVYIPDSLFSGGDYVYMYSKFGESESSTYANSGSFEEWAVRVGVAPPPRPGVPAPGALLLALLGGNGVLWLRRRKLL